jgi:hypothetical protein
MKIQAKASAAVFFAGGAIPLALLVSLTYIAVKDPPGSSTIGSFISALFAGALSLIGTLYMFMRGWRIWSGREEKKEG